MTSLLKQVENDLSDLYYDDENATIRLNKLIMILHRAVKAIQEREKE